MKTLHISYKCSPIHRENGVVYRLKEVQNDILVQENAVFDINSLQFTITNVQDTSIELQNLDKIIKVNGEKSKYEVVFDETKYQITFQLR